MLGFGWAIGCSSGPPRPQPGSDAFLWAEAKQSAPRLVKATLDDFLGIHVFRIGQPRGPAPATAQCSFRKRRLSAANVPHSPVTRLKIVRSGMATLVCGGKFRPTIGVLALAAVAVGLMLFTWPHWWPRSHKFTVTYDGVLVQKPEVHRGKDCFLSRLTNLSDSDYLVYPVAHELGGSPGASFLVFSGARILERHPGNLHPD
jgi:hypothetical protein